MSDDFEPIPFVGYMDLRPAMPHEAIAQELGISRQAVRNIEERALEKARLELIKKGVLKSDLL